MVWWCEARWDPFWTLGVGPAWIMEIEPRPRPTPTPEPKCEEVVYRDAKLTNVVVFPEIDRTARDLRLIVPQVGIRSADAPDTELESELIFEQIVQAGSP